MKTLFISMIVSLLLAACEDIYPNYKYFTGHGGMKIEKHNVPGFTEIESNIGADITITRGTDYAVSVTAQENILPYILTNISNGKLVISTGNYTIHSDSLISVMISVPELEAFSLSGSGVIHSECPVKRISLSGAGEIICSGTTDQVQARLSGTGIINLTGLHVKKADVRISGNGNVKVNASEQLDISISGMGNVYFFGNPEISSTVSGIGSIIQLN